MFNSNHKGHLSLYVDHDGSVHKNNPNSAKYRTRKTSDSALYNQNQKKDIQGIYFEYSYKYKSYKYN